MPDAQGETLKEQTKIGTKDTKEEVTPRRENSAKEISSTSHEIYPTHNRDRFQQYTIRKLNLKQSKLLISTNYFENKIRS